MKPFYIKLLSIILISGLGTLVYSNTFHCSFHFDDDFNISQNFAIKNIYNLHNIWSYYYSRFFTVLSLSLNYHFNGLHVFGYHVFNLMVHLLSALFVWWLVLLTLCSPAMKEQKITQHANTIALLAGLVFVSHPLQTEAVTYIWERGTSMAALFYLASLGFYVKSRLLQDSVFASVNPAKGPALGGAKGGEAKPRHGGVTSPTRKHSPSPDEVTCCRIGNIDTVLRQRIYYIGSLTTAVVAMFTKENTVTLPLMILFYEFTFLKTKRGLDWKYISPFLLTIFIVPFTVLLSKSETFQHLHGDLRASGGTITPMHYFLTQFRVMVTYIRLVFWPLNQNLDYDYPVFKNIFELPVLISLLFLMTIFYWAKQLFLKYRLVSFSIFWFFLTLMIPESSFWAMGDVIFEHRLYLPLAGYSMFLVGGVYYLFGKNSIKTMVMALSLIIACNSVLTYQRNKVWKDEFTLWNDAVGKSPHKIRPHYNRGRIYYNQGQFAQAISDYNKAIEIGPDFAGAYNDRGVIYSREGNFTLGLSDYNKAIAIDPDYADPYNNRGSVYVKQGNYLQALSDFNKAIAINPDYAQAYYNRGLVHDKQGDFTLSLSDYNKAIEINPDYADAYNNRGLVYDKQGNYPQALSDYNKAIEIDPDNPQAHNNRGNIYAKQGDFTLSLSDYNKAITLNPKYADAYYNRGFAWDEKGQLTNAISDYNKAIELAPQYAIAYNNRAVSYYQLKEYDKAWADVQKAKELGMHVNPEFINALKDASEHNATLYQK